MDTTLRVIFQISKSYPADCMTKSSYFDKRGDLDAQITKQYKSIYLLTPTTVAGVKGLAASVCVCRFVRSITQNEWSQSAQTSYRDWMTFGYPRIGFPRYGFGVERSKVKVTRSQSAKKYWRRPTGRRGFVPVRVRILCSVLHWLWFVSWQSLT